MIFSKEKNEELREQIRSINKLKTQSQRVDATIEQKEKLHAEINDEVDDIFAAVNLKKDKEEE